MKIPKRINKILELLPECDLLADVGCDHGILGVAALKQKKAKKVIFTDISNPSLQKAKIYAQQNDVFDKCEFLLGDGLCGRKVDCAVIAGMGAKEILKILFDAKDLPEYLVLNPMRNTDTVRKKLADFYYFERDEKLYDKKYYDLIKLRFGRDSLDELQVKYGKTNLEFFGEDFCKYLLEEQSKCVTILNKIQNTETQQKLKEIENLLNRSKNAG